jgi:ribonuclease T2
MTRVVLRLALLALLLTPQAASAQDSRQNLPGQFDFYVLSLSWSPSFCAGAAERGASQCVMRSATLFLRRQGLWPQYDEGFPAKFQRRG